MAINFPDNPSIGQQATFNNNTWEWNGTVWNIVPAAAATIQIGNVVSGAVASVTNVGTINEAILDFVLEKGDKGDPGAFPAGGSIRQFIVKKSATDFDIEWSSILAADIPTGIDATKIGAGLVSNTEFGYLDGVTSAIQTQLNGKQATLTNPVTGTGTSGQVSFFNGTSTVTGDNGLFWDNTNKRLGLLNAAPLAALHVGNRNATGSTDPLILASRTINSGSGNSRGFSDSTNYARSGGTSYASYDARIEMTGTNNFGHYAGFQAGPTFNFTGTITDVFNYISSPTFTAGTITNSYGTYVQNPVKTGATLTNNYGHYFPSVFNAGTNNWVWYNSSTERSYSAGDTISRRFFAGSNSVATPQAQFHADGSGDIRLRLQQSGFNYWDFTSVSGTTYATIADVSGTYVTFFNLGNVALGTTTNNGYKLDIQGSLRNTTSAYFATASGNVGIGNTSASYKLDVTGGVRSTTSSFFATGSGVVSIGSISGNGKLFVVDDVDGDVTINFQNSNAGTSARIRLGFNSAAGSWFLTHPRTGGNFSIFNDTNEFVTITRTSGNFGLGQTTFGTSATKTLAIGSGVAPTTSPADAFQLYSADITAGNAAPHFRTEGGAVVKIYQQTTGVGAATRVGGGGTTVTDTDTFGGYTIQQIVQALQNTGFLA